MENKIYIVDDEGKEVEMEILFTFDVQDKHYVIVHTEDSEEYYPFTYDGDGNIQAIEDEEEFAMVNEVFNTFEGIEDEEDI